MKKNNSHHAKSRRPQASKNKEYMRAMQELRRSSATSPIPSGRTYKRPAPGRRWE